MPQHLDLTDSCTPAKMILSSRNSPRLSLRRAASYNNSDRGPLSSTSSRFSFNHILASPPPSPGLPALVPRHGKQTVSHKPQRVFRGIVWLFGVLVILFYGFSRMRLDRPLPSVGWATNAADQYEMVGGSELPDFPTPVVITDKRGRAKWTVFIPPDHPFPLQPKQYQEICHQNMMVASHVQDLHIHMHRVHAGHFGYYRVDGNFMDVAEAEAHGILPGSKGKTNMFKDLDGSVIGEKMDGLIESEVCDRTMTVVLETSDAGLGNTLMTLWTSYGLAQKEGRHFFIDDTRWAYGKYTNYFKLPPMPKCRPPPRHQMLPCPHSARHLVVSAATTPYTFGGGFNEEFEDPRKMEVYRQRPIFDLARAGYEALFHLARPDADYVTKRIIELKSKTLLAPPERENGTIIGVHIRHGDKRPLEFQYKDSYIPLDSYSDKARDLITHKYNHTGFHGSENMMAEMHSLMVVASDDPDVYDSDEFSHAARAQEQIRLASKKTLESANPALPARRKSFVDEQIGWEGGFFAAMFWSLGKPSSIPVTAMSTPETKLPPTEEALRLRELVGRAYLMDLAVLGQASDMIVCTVSAMGCKVLAVMMGWEKAMDKKGFVNIDGDFEWRGVRW